jgi:hypothetical protein
LKVIFEADAAIYAEEINSDNLEQSGELTKKE